MHDRQKIALKDIPGHSRPNRAQIPAQKYDFYREIRKIDDFQENCNFLFFVKAIQSLGWFRFLLFLTAICKVYWGVIKCEFRECNFA